MNLLEEDRKMLVPWAIAMVTLSSDDQQEDARAMLIDIIFKSSNSPEQTTTRALGLIDTLVQMNSSSMHEIAELTEADVFEILSSFGINAALESEGLT